MIGIREKIIKVIVSFSCLNYLFIVTSSAQVISSYDLESNVLCGRIKIRDYKTNKIGFMDISGNVVIPCKYNAEILKKSCYFREGYAAVSLGVNQCGWIDTLGNPISDFCYSYCGPFINGCAIALKQEERRKIKYFMVKNGGRLNIIDSEGYKNYIFPSLYYVKTTKSESSNSLTEFDLYNANDSLIGQFCTEGIPYIYNNTFLTVFDKEKKKWGIIDTIGRIIYDFMFDEKNYFIENSIVAKYKGKYGIISEENAYVYDDFYTRDGYIILCKDGISYIYDKYNKTIKMYEKDSVNFGSYKVKNHYGYRDLNKTINIPCVYNSDVYFNESGYALVENNNCKMIINKSGKCLIISYKKNTQNCITP